MSCTNSLMSLPRELCDAFYAILVPRTLQIIITSKNEAGATPDQRSTFSTAASLLRVSKEIRAEVTQAIANQTTLELILDTQIHLPLDVLAGCVSNNPLNLDHYPFIKHIVLHNTVGSPAYDDTPGITLRVLKYRLDIQLTNTPSGKLATDKLGVLMLRRNMFKVNASDIIEEELKGLMNEVNAGHSGLFGTAMVGKFQRAFERCYGQDQRNDQRNVTLRYQVAYLRELERARDDGD